MSAPTMSVQINVFRRSYAKYAQAVKFDETTVAITRYGRVVAYFVPAGKLADLALIKTEEQTAEAFRNKIGPTWERLCSGELEAMYVTHHDRPRGAMIGLEVGKLIGLQPGGATYDG